LDISLRLQILVFKDWDLNLLFIYKNNFFEEGTMSHKINNEVTVKVSTFYKDISRTITDYVSPYIPFFTTERALASIAAIFVVKKTIDIVSKLNKQEKLFRKAQQKRNERDDKMLNEFTPTLDIPNNLESMVLNASVTELMYLLNEGKVTSEMVLRIYHNRCIKIGLRLELIAESNFDEALRDAKKCDDLRKIIPKEERSRLGDLYGVPISIKDSLEQKGLDATCGLAKNCYRPCVEDGAPVKLIRAQGAIPFIKTNVAQSLTLYTSVNHIWGKASNPWNVNRTTGGSSGGEAGLIAARASPIGYGSDYYGSIRIPASFNGIYGFKSTCGRLPATGEVLMAPHDLVFFSFLRASTGPLGRCTEDLVLLMKGMLTPAIRELDPLASLIPWDEKKYRSNNPLKIGYVLSEDFFGASKPCKRAVRESVDALRKAGHDVVEIRIPNFELMALQVFKILSLDGKANRPTQALEGEKPVSDLALPIMLNELPNCALNFMKLFFGQRMKNILDCMKEQSANEMILTLAKFCELRNQFLKFWTERGLDAIITPALALPAFKHGSGSKLQPAACYLWIANIANLPSGVVPVTKVSIGEDTYDSEDSIYTNDMLFTCAQDCMKGSIGLPVGVQVMTLPWEDEKCLAIMKTLEDQIKFHQFPNLV
jgi:fatty acid amide hydrolase